MAAVGGSIESVNLSGREYPVITDAEVERKLGGFENEVEANGNATARLLKTRVPLSLDGIVVEIDDSLQDFEFLQDLSNSNDFFPIAITFASGLTYQGSAQLVGETQGNSQKATASISLKGPGILTQQ